MRRLIRLLCTAASVLIPCLSTAQAPVPVQSSLLSVVLPESTTLNRSFLYREVAKASLRLDANRMRVSLGARQEVFRLPMSAPPQAQLVEALQRAGWTVTMDPSTPSTGVAVRSGVPSVMISFIDGRKDRWLYAADLAPAAAAVAVSTPPAAGSRQPALPAAVSQGTATTSMPAPMANRPSPSPTSASPAPSGNGFAFTTTNFDDGWTSTIDTEFVTIGKGDIRIFQHYKREEENAYMSVLEEQTRRFWNLLVTPRYRDLANLVVERNNPGGYQAINYAAATGTESSSGRRVYIVLFSFPDRRTGWMEFVTPDQATFEREFGPYRGRDTQWDRWIAMAGRNRFAVAASDFVGTWSDNFASGTSMVFSATGRAAGMLYAGGNTTVTFDGRNYTMDVAGGSGMVGSIRMQNATYKGAFSVANNWSVTFGNNFEGRTRRFHASFEGVRDGRILNLVLDEPGAPITLHMVRVR